MPSDSTVNGARFPNPQGLPLFSLQAGSKMPREKKFWRAASPDSSKIPTGCNAGVITGGGLIVLDLDVKNGKDGIKALAALVALHDDLPATYTVETPTGGRHLYFRDPLGRDFGQGTDRLGPGIDVKADPHGYVVAAGSVIDDRRYEIIIDDAPIADAPEWLIDLLSRSAPRSRKTADQTPLVELDTASNIDAAIAYLENDAGEATNGSGGDEATFRVACFVRDYGISESMVLDLMLEHWNETKAHDPWDPDDLAVKVHNAFNYAKNRHGSKAAALAVNEFPKLPDSIIAAIANQKPPARTERSPTPAAREKRGLTKWGRFTTRKTKWLIRGLLPVGGLAALYGQPGAYKSFVVIYMSGMVAAGRPFFGRRTKQASVIYVAAEGAQGLAQSTAALGTVHGLGELDVYFMEHPLDLQSSYEDCDELLGLISDKDLEPGLIVIDTLARSFGGGDENSSKDMGAFIRVMDYIRDKTGAAVMVVHHTGKSEAKGLRGHSSLLGAIDSGFEVKQIDKAPAEGRGNGTGLIRVTKQKYGPDGLKIPFIAERVLLSSHGSAAEEFGDGEGHGQGESGDDWEHSSLAVRPLKDGESAGPQVATLAREPRLLLDAIKGIARVGEQITQRQLRDAARDTRWLKDAPDKKSRDRESQRLCRARDELIGAGYLDRAGKEFALTPLAYTDNLTDGEAE